MTECVFLKDGEWQNEVEGGDRVPADFSTKEEAVVIGRARALADETKRDPQPDGTISERSSYSNDPVNP